MADQDHHKKTFRDRFYRFFRWTLDKLIGPKRKRQLRHIILYTDTPAGHRFDKFIVALIVISVLIVIVETMPNLPKTVIWVLYGIEWLITILFTIEYVLRIYVERNPGRYIFSFYGIVDLLSFLPTYISIFFFGTQHLLIIRILRLFRIFRIFKLGHFVSEGGIVVDALRASRVKIYVFLSFILLMATLVGSMMYMVEHAHNPLFKSIASGIYWAIVTITTVGYGDVIPVTTVGRMLSTVVMILGYGVLAVPTGIVTAEISNRVLDVSTFNREVCRNCGNSHHFEDARYCHNCGIKIHPSDN
ncbi:MAG: ion transporter [Saprospiraceae bacterium]|nr:ion transporter [Saprospiraceae bacterium]